MAPPKTRLKLSQAARNELGQMRKCAECDDWKEVNDTNYALLTAAKGGRRGWHTVCRACQGVSSAEARVTHRVAPEVSSEDVTEPVRAMYAYQASGKKAKAEEIAGSLARELRVLVDAGREAEAFETFIEIVKPLFGDGWMEPGDIHNDIKQGLLSGDKRVLIIATRYSAKSTLTAIYVAFEIWKDPLIKIMVISRGAKLAARMLRTVRRILIAGCPMLFHLEPTDECLDNAEQFQTPESLKVITGGVTLTSLGMGSNLPGFRSDLTIGDDVEGPQDDTPEKVAALEEALNELHMINPRGRKIMLGTYQSEFSIYAKLGDLQDDQGKPVWNTVRACMFSEDEIDGKLVIHSRWPAMFSDTTAMDWRRSVTTRAWKLHAMLIADPSILHERPLKIGDLPVLDWDPKAVRFPVMLERTGNRLPELPRWSAPKGDEWNEARALGDHQDGLAGIIMAVDPASGLAGRDAIGVAVLGITQGGMGLILHLEGVRASDKALARKRVAEIGKDYRATVCVVEELADGLFGETLESDFVHLGYPMTVEKVTTGGQQKGRRIIESLGPPMGAGRLAILKCIVATDHGGEFVNQLVRISYDGRTGSKKDHDDIVDALAHAVFRVKTSLISDVAENMASHKQTQLDRWARVPLRQGGLGAHEDDEFPHIHRADTGQVDLGQALMEEDEVVIALQERRDRLQGVVNDDIRFGRKADPTMVRRIRGLTKQIEELKALQVF